MSIPSIKNPAAVWLMNEPRDNFRMGEVLISTRQGLHIRHEKDLGKDFSELRQVSLSELRTLVQTNPQGAFRPLKSAPDLCSGWRVEMGIQDLESALNILYPGALADLFRFINGEAATEVTSFRTFTARQTGMYRIASRLTDEEVSPAIEACCDNRVCRKTRLWDPNGAREATLEFNIPCLEPCALMLEFARKSSRMNDQKAEPKSLTNSDLETIKKALDFTLNSITVSKVADFSDETNQRRLLLASIKINAALGK
jgi:hypothetical protein